MAPLTERAGRRSPVPKDQRPVNGHRSAEADGRSAGRRAEDARPVALPFHEERPARRRYLRPTVFRAGSSISEGAESRTIGVRDQVYRHALALADGSAALLALAFAVALTPRAALGWPALLVVPGIVLVAKVKGLYDRDEVVLNKTTLDEAPRLFQVATLYALLATLAAEPLTGEQLRHPQAILALWGGAFSAMLVARWAAREVARTLTATERVLLMGDEGTVEAVRRKIDSSGGVHVEFVGRLPLDQDGDHPAQLRALEEAIGREDVHRVILAPAVADTDSMLDVIRLVKGLGVKATILPRMFEVVGNSVEFDDVDGMMMLGIRRFGLTRSSRRLKRALDLAGAGLGLLAVAPLMAMVALLIRLDSGGPILFRQIRVGRDGERFKILKFRTMVDGADALKDELRERNETDGLFKIADDPRVTRVGRFLRRTSLDELPQLFNVLNGEMSLVGPRPLVVDEDSKLVGWHRRRLHLTPGMTGPWQILGSSRVPLHEMVKIDYLYVANWSFWADVKILVRTVPYMLRRGGM